MNHSDKDTQFLVKEKIKTFELASDWIPGIKIIQGVDPIRNLFICNFGRKHYGLTKSFFEFLPIREYRKLIFDPEGPSTCLMGKTDVNHGGYPEKRVYIRLGPITKDHIAELVTIQTLAYRNDGQPLLELTHILPLNLEEWVMNKIRRTVNEIRFKKKNYQRFEQLTERNKEVLSLMAKCHRADEIARRLSIEPNTVNTHKKRIKEILEIEKNWDIIKYGQAFEL
tara:strand:+ start:27582 stop:28256 length:675 start_codon:yes stop_codon:yes gene_type:complete